MLDIIKLALRLSNDLFDEEIKMYVQSCKNDLVLGGVNKDKLDDTDQSLQAVVIAYVKHMMNYQGDGEKWQKIYVNMKTSLALNSDYTSEV